MSNAFSASAQWATRPADERFTSLRDMLAQMTAKRQRSRQLAIASRSMEVLPAEDNKGIGLRGPQGGVAEPSHWAFGQLAALAEAPAGYLRTLPSPIAADCINYGLKFKRDVEDVGLLLERGVEGGVNARAITGPKYGRIWNSDIVEGTIERFGDGTGRDGSDWSVPGIFGKELSEITKENTTLYAGDRDCFVFLADERNRVEVKARRNGEPGTLARGFFIKNSEVGAATLEVSTFLFDYVCFNRIIWGARQWRTVAIRHTPKAPLRWADEVAPALASYRQDSTKSITSAIEAAQAARIDSSGSDVTEFLAKRFGKRMPVLLHDIHMEEEGRPIETLWDASVAITAYARGVKWQDERVELERKGGELLQLAA